MNSIFIIGIPRSGTTNLLKSFASSYNLKPIFEPTYEKLKKLDINNVVVKVVAGDWFPVDKLMEQSRRFDQTVLISRKDIRASAESLYVMKKYNNMIKDMQWGHQYIPDFLEEEQHQHESNDVLHQFSKLTSIKVNYYEDVYKNKRLLEKNLKLDLKYLDSKLKLKFSNEKTLL